MKSTDFSDKKQFVYVKESVLRFFLNTYKLQLGASEQDLGKFIYIESQLYGQTETYELQVRRDNKWMSRRMGIAPLGDGTGSKSKCFKVFYDDILVIKIPPSPIKDFEKYIEGIYAERRIANHLMPDVECIFPSISALLKKIPPFSSESDIFPEDLERKYIELLRQDPFFQQYLKIGDTFAFFMSLSKHSFFSSVLEEMHDRKNKLREEIMAQSDVLWDALAFEEKYGADKSTLFFNISDVYTAYEKNIILLAKKYNIFSIPIYKRKEWFLEQLAETDFEKEENPIPAHELTRIFTQMLPDEKNVVEQYRKTMTEYVYHRSFEQNKTKAKAIIRNILTLLAAMERKGVAIRDLKPDNIFVIGDSRFSDFSMGLIDFETAVLLNPCEYEDILQPMMAGTPSYATPSHLFRNEVLTELLANLPRVMHHQDWYAMIVMIYHTITGDRLFEETRKMLPKIGKIVHNPLPEGMTMTKLFKHCSRTFWNSAQQEFLQKIGNHRQMLDVVEISVPEDYQTILQQENAKFKTNLALSIRAHIRAQNIFKSEKSCQDLLRASHKMIRQSRINWEKGVNVPKSQPAIRLRIISFLQKLEELKFQYNEKSRYKELLDKENSQLSVYDLLSFMFEVVITTMYKPEWEEAEGVGSAEFDLTDQVSYEKTISVEEISTEETMSYEKTIPEFE
jgi:serine/threonine protein kinase